MFLRFCTARTLPRSTRSLIYKKMTWENGTMREWLYDRLDLKLCLLYNGKLATWAALGRRDPDRLDVSAWTREEYRKRGYGQAAIWALLDRHRISHKQEFHTYSAKTRRILNRLGYTG